MFHEVNEAITNGRWVNEGGVTYFYTDDIIGGSRSNDDRKGPYIKVYTGFNSLQGRVKSKIYAIEHCVMNVNVEKDWKDEGKSTIDIRDVNREKLRNGLNKMHLKIRLNNVYVNLIKPCKRLFHTVFNNYFVKVLWSRKDASNSFLKKIGEAVYKYFDIIANTSKMYCYRPTPANKNDMARGLVGLKGHQERPELNAHYNSSKNSFTTSISFCADCGEGKCPLNRYPAHMILATAELIETCLKLPGEEQVLLTMHDFFREDELEYFLEQFTRPVTPLTHRDASFNWTNKKFDWPRMIIQDKTAERPQQGGIRNWSYIHLVV